MWVIQISIVTTANPTLISWQTNANISLLSKLELIGEVDETQAESSSDKWGEYAMREERYPRGPGGEKGVPLARSRVQITDSFREQG